MIFFKKKINQMIVVHYNLTKISQIKQKVQQDGLKKMETNTIKKMGQK